MVDGGKQEEHVMRIMIIQPWIQLGGAETISIELAKHLADSGNEAAIVCTYVNFEGMPEGKLDSRFIIPSDWLRSVCQRSRIFFLLFGPWILLYLAWKHAPQFDILNPHNFPSLWIAVIVGKLRNKKIVWTCNEPPERISFRRAVRLGIGDFLGWLIASSWIDTKMARLADAIYVPSKKTQQDVLERYGISSTIVPLGVDYEFYSEGRRSECRSKMELNGHFVLLVVGKLHPQKNQGVCIDALDSILPHIPHAVLLLAGSGPMESEHRIRARELGISEKIRFLGTVESYSIRDLYSACDVNLLPAVNQSWGLTPFEALSAGRISIVSNDTGAAEIISEHDIGIVSDPTSEQFAEAILQFHKNPDVYAPKATKGRNFVQESLGWDQYAERVSEILLSVGGGSE